MASSYQSPASGSASSSVAEQQQGYYAGLPSSQGGNAQSDADMFASSSEPSPPRSHLDGGGPLGSHYESPLQFQNAMDLVQRLQAQLKTVRLDKDRLKERCFLLEREVNDNLRHHHPSSTSYASPLPMLATAPPSTTTSHKRGPHKHHRHHNYQPLEKALAEERATRSDLQARLAKAEAQLKSRDKEVHSLQKRLHISHAEIQEAETKFLSDLSRLFKSVHPEEDVGERAKWERELGLALAEVKRLKKELTGLSSSGVRKEEQQEDNGTGMTATTSMITRPLRGGKTTTSEKSRRREQEKGWTRLQEKILRQAERIRADKKLIRLLKKEIGRVQEEEGERVEELLASREAQKGLRVELAASAQRHEEDLEYELRKEVGATRAVQALGEEREEGGNGGGLGEGWVLVNVEREGEEGSRWRCKKEKNEKGKEVNQRQKEEVLYNDHRHHHHHRYDRKEDEEENQLHAPDQLHSRRHRHHQQQHDEQQQQQQQRWRRQSPSQIRRKSRTRGGKTRTSSWSTPPRAKPQAWEINFPPGKKEYEVSPLIHRFETYENGK
eukprot:evm.model.NODE_5207_length_48865_cov_35.227627.7